MLQNGYVFVRNFEQDFLSTSILGKFLTLFRHDFFFSVPKTNLEIWEKNEEFDELDRGAKTVSETIRDLERKRQK
jgi:hypothetical protein